MKKIPHSKEILVQEKTVKIVFRKIKRAKHIRIHISSGEKVLVTGPTYAPYRVMEAFFNKEKKWIIQKIIEVQETPVRSQKLSVADYKKKKEGARKLVLKKLEYWNQYYNHSWKRVTIRNQSTRWGSYSASGTLSFHAGIVDIPEELQDYLIVHELCHIQHMNHGAYFWKAILKTLPSGKKLDIALKNYTKGSIL